MLTQIEMTQARPSEARLRAAGLLAFTVAIVAAVGVVLLIAMFATFALPRMAPAIPFGMLNDICVAIQYALTIPLALVVYQILALHNRPLIRLATVVGIGGMVTTVLLQLALISDLLSFEQQVGWVMLAMFGAVGPWLLITALVGRSSGALPHGIAASILAVPYLGYPVWAFWLGRRLLNG